MNRLIRSACILTLTMFSLVFLPMSTFAADGKSETVTVEVNTTTPSGVSIIGTLVIHRQGGAEVNSNLSFNGMVNGSPASAEATATENWSGDGQAQITINEITAWNSTLPRPANLTISLSQTSAGLVSLNGIPMAIDGLLQQPFSGRTSYTVTGAGKGSSQIVMLPRTGDGQLILDPLWIVGLLVVPGLVLITISALLRKAGPHPTAAKL